MWSFRRANLAGEVITFGVQFFIPAIPSLFFFRLNTFDSGKHKRAFDTFAGIDRR